MKKIGILLVSVLWMAGCGELQDIVNQLPNQGIGDEQIAAGLKEALEKGIDRQVTTLMTEGGFYNQPDVRILLPDELKKMDQTLRQIGLDNLADEGIRMLNRAAEEAVKEAKPVFVQAIKEMTFEDARNILMGGQTAATEYLKRKTSDELYRKFYPVVQQSFQKVGADRIWNEIISRYNQIPLVEPVNADLNDYVTRKALEGVFKKIADEEKHIRTDIRARTTDLLKQVFALQDNKQ